MLCFMLTHRRLTPYLHLPLDDLQSLHDGLQTLACLTGGAVYGGNSVSVLQNGALFPRKSNLDNVAFVVTGP